MCKRIAKALAAGAVGAGIGAAIPKAKAPKSPKRVRIPKAKIPRR